MYINENHPVQTRESFCPSWRWLSLRTHASEARICSGSLLQAQLVDLRSELTDAKAERAVVERVVHDQLLQLHALQLQLHNKQGQTPDSDSIKDRLVGTLVMHAYYTSITIRFTHLCCTNKKRRVLKGHKHR